MTNPKAIVFFVALFPSFISPEHHIMLQSLVHGAIFLALDTIAILDYALLAIHAVREATSRWLNVEVLSGAVLGMIVKGYLDIPSN